MIAKVDNYPGKRVYQQCVFCDAKMRPVVKSNGEWSTVCRKCIKTSLINKMQNIEESS